MGLPQAITSTSIGNTWVQNLPSIITWGQSRPGHPALRGSLEDPEGTKGVIQVRKKVVLKRTRHGRVIIAMGTGGVCKSGCNTLGVEGRCWEHPGYKSLEGLLSVLGSLRVWEGVVMRLYHVSLETFHVWDRILLGLLTRFCLLGLLHSEGPPHCSIHPPTSVRRFPGLR